MAALATALADSLKPTEAESLQEAAERAAKARAAAELAAKKKQEATLRGER